MIAAMAGAARERGAAAVSITDVVVRAGVSRRTFYEVFRDRDECLEATLEEAIARAAGRMLPAWRSEESWQEAVRAALFAFLVFLDVEPTLGMFLLVDSLGAGDRALARRAEATQVLVDAVDRGRGLPRAAAGLTPMTAEGVVGAVLALVHARLLARSQREAGEPMARLLGQLMSVLVLPYLGPAAAAREQTRSTSSPVHRQAPIEKGVGDLGIRLTYRTVMVLRALGELSAQDLGPSNREIGAHAGIADQGQISKLLQRLAKVGLIENLGGGRELGEPNAWKLTDRGAQIERATRGGQDPGSSMGHP
jgi:AcrR family transcriptional regulator